MAPVNVCGHNAVAVSSGFSCEGGPDHEGDHWHDVVGRATREPLGWGDNREVTIRVSWPDDRPPAVYADFLALAGEPRG